jgi:hypothetical protein
MSVIDIIRQTMEEIEEAHQDVPGEYRSVLVIEKLYKMTDAYPMLVLFLNDRSLIQSIMTSLVEAAKGYYKLTTSKQDNQSTPSSLVYFNRRHGTAHVLGSR